VVVSFKRLGGSVRKANNCGIKAILAALDNSYVTITLRFRIRV